MAIADLPALPPVKGDVKTPFTVQARETHEGASSWLSSDPGMARPTPCREQPHGGACPGGRCQASDEANVSTISRSRTTGVPSAGENFHYGFKGAQSAPDPGWPPLLGKRRARMTLIRTLRSSCRSAGGRRGERARLGAACRS